MTISPRIRLAAYVTGYLLAGVWAALAPYLAHRGVDSYTIALVSALVAVFNGGVHAVAAGHVTLPSLGDPVSADDGSDLSVTTLEPSVDPAPAPAADAPAAPVPPATQG